MGFTLLASVALTPATLQTARADAPSVTVEAEWPVGSASGSLWLPTVAVDSRSQTGIVLSLSNNGDQYDLAQAIDARTGRVLTPKGPIPALLTTSPVVVDSQHQLIIYPERTARAAGIDSAPAVATNLIGLGLRAGALRELFRVPWRVSGEPISALQIDPATQDLLVLGSGKSGLAGPHVDRLSLAALVHGTLTPRWDQPFQVPVDACQDVLATNQPASMLLRGTVLSFACRPYRGGRSGVASATIGQPAGVVVLDGVSAVPAPAIRSTLFPAPGDFSSRGEAFAEPRTGRVVLESAFVGDSTLRVFDSLHRHYVGVVKLGGGLPAGLTSNPATGRIYAAKINPGALAVSDLLPVVPTQGVFNELADLVNASVRLSFNAGTQRLLLPHVVNGKAFIAVLRDDVPPLRPPGDVDYDAGALDAVDRPGITDSSRSTSAAAYGAQYALIGGVGGLSRNIVGTEDSTGRFKSGRWLREAVVQSAGLSADASTALAVMGTEDSGTDQNRQEVADAPPPSSPVRVDAGSSFAPSAACSDFGTTPSTSPVVVLTAKVQCDAAQAQTAASATFSNPGALVMGLPGRPADVPAAVQVGRASAEVSERQLPHRGPLVTTVTSRATNIDLLGLATIGSVSSTVTVSANGRHGTARAATPVVTVSGLTVGGQELCDASCTTEQVATALNKALGVRGHVEFVRPDVISTRGGTFASVRQDPWTHAEQVLDYEQSEEDYTVPAMTITVFLEGATTSRLVVNLAAVSATAIYRVFPIGGILPPPPAPIDTTTPPQALQIVPVPAVATVDTHQSVAPVITPGGFLTGLVRGLRFSLRSPSAAWPLILVWSLFALAPYLSARRRLLLELPLLTRELESP